MIDYDLPVPFFSAILKLCLTFWLPFWSAVSPWRCFRGAAMAISLWPVGTAGFDTRSDSGLASENTSL